MAKLLTGTRIYGTGTVDTQLFVSGTNSATSTTTGALQVVGGVGVGGNLHVGGIIYGAILGTATTATNSDNVKTVLSTSTSVFFPVFVDSNNATAGYEAVYSSSTFTIIPSSGNVGIGVATPTEKLHVAGNYLLLKNTADTAAGAVFDSGSTLGQNTQILLRDRGSDKWAVRKNSANNFDIYGSAVGAAALTIFSSTNFVGIGATVIEDVLHVRRDSTATSTGIVIQNRSASGLPEAGIKFITGSFDLADTRYAEISSTGTSSPSLIFKTANGATPIERMRITALGGISFGASGTAYGVSGQILQSNGNAAPTWISTGSLAAANATTATHLSGGVAGQIPYQTAPGVTAFLSTGTAGDVLVSNGSSAATYNNTLRLAGATNATSTSSGALQVVGGVGVGGDLFIQGDIRTNDTLFNLINGNAITVNFAGDATTLTMGASGSGTTNVRNNLTVNGNLTVQGTTTIVDSTVTNIADPIITLGGGTGNSAPTADDNKDRGVAFKYVSNAGTTSTGFFGYDDSTGYLTYVQTATITNEVVSGTKGAMDVNLAGGTAMSVVYQSSPNNTAFLAASTSGYILQTNGTGVAPSWVSASGVSAGSATYADNVRTIAQTASASYYPTFVDSNNASNAYELVYTTSSFSINPATGVVTIAAPAGGDGVPSLRITQGTAPSTFNWLSSFLNSSLTAGKNLISLIGQAESGNNSAYFGFKYVGASSASNFATIGLYGADNLLNILANGNVGIGTTSPAQKLDVRGYIVSDVNSNAVEGGFYLGNSGHGIRRPVSTNDVYVYTTGGTLYLTANGSTSTQVTILNSGNVGIGTTTPSQKLYVVGNGLFDGFTYWLYQVSGTPGSTSPSIWSPALGHLGFWGNGAERMRITNSGGISFGATGTAYGTSGQVLKSNGDAAPTWVDPSTLASASATNADNIRTIAQAANASYYPTFVDSNNASNAYELVYTTSSFQINPFTGNIQIGMTSQDYQPSSGGNHTIRLNAANTSSIGFHDSGSTIGNIKFSGAYGFEIGAYDGTYGPHNTILHGSVGIGTQSPGAKLEVYVSRTASTNAVALLLNDNVTGAQTNGVYKAIRSQSNGGSSVSEIRFVETDGTNNNTAIAFATAPTAGGLTERMRVGPDGNVGIGIVATERFHVFGTAYGAATQGPRINLQYSGTSGAAESLLQFLDFRGVVNASMGSNLLDDGVGTAAAAMVFKTATAGTLTERLRITRNGGISFGASGTAYGTSGQVLQSNGDAAPTWVSSIGGSAGQVSTVLQTASASYFPTFVDSNNASATAESLYTTSSFSINPQSGNVGIGTTSPAAKLDLYNVADAGSAANGIRVQRPASYGQYGYLEYLVSSDITVLGSLYTGGTASSYGQIYFRQHSNGGAIKDAMVINGSNNVGIGVTGPAHKLDISAPTTYSYAQGSYSSGATLALRAASTTANDYTGIRFVNSAGSREAFFGVVQGTTANIGDFVFQTYSAATTSYGERMRVMHNGNVIIGGSGSTATNKFEVAGTAGQLFSVSDSFTGTIFAASDVSGIPSIEVLDTGLVKLAQYNGAVTIGTGTVSSSTAELSVYGMLYTSGAQGEIRASSEITAYFSSDRRLKENIKLIENPITIIDQIRGVTFDWTDEHMARRGGEDGYFVRKHDIGVIAQEVQAVLPELVGTREDGYLAVKYEKMVPLLIEAIKEQQKSIDMLKFELEKLKNNKTV